MPFLDRADAGRRLAERLGHLRGQPLTVLGLPRGGVAVAFEVATAMDAPLDVILVRKVGVPFQPELAMGAIGEDGVRIVNREVVRAARIGEEQFAAVERAERAELQRRAGRFRAGRPRADLTGRTAVIVDDGIATGATARAACQVARAHGAARVVLAVPVAPPESLADLEADADEIVCVEAPRMLVAIGYWYEDFSQTLDDDVVALLEAAAARPGLAPPAPVAPDPSPAGTDHGPGGTDHSPAIDHSPATHQPPGGTDHGPGGTDHDVEVPLAGRPHPGRLTVPPRAAGLVLFAHGSGSSSRSPRNRFVAGALNQAGLATLLFDLLTRDEERDRANVFDVRLLADRLGEATAWVAALPATAGLPLGYFGASTGAAAALLAAAEEGSAVAAVVSRGGRPDLAGPALGAVRAPTLLIVGGLDGVVIDLNREARAELKCESRLEIVPGAGHLFEEPGTLEAVAALARDWFLAHLG